MPRITVDLRKDERVLRLRLVGDIDDTAAIAWFKWILKAQPRARALPTLIELHEYEEGITWKGIIELARIRGPAPAGPRNRTAIVANTAHYALLTQAIDLAYTTLIARRVRVFDTEAEALAWLREPKAERARAPARGGRKSA
jgi:hypothetical protein